MPTAFPYSTLAAMGIYPRKMRELKPEYMVTMSPRYGDGGQDTSIGGTSPTRRWQIEYAGLSPAEADIIDVHYESCLGEHLGFTFTYPHTLVVHPGTKYESYERDHSVTFDNTQTRQMVLVKKP